MIYNPKCIQSGLVCMINEIRVTRMRDAVAVPAFTPTGDRRMTIDRWNVADTPLPQGTTPADVAGHFAALSPFGAGSAVMIDALEALPLWDAIRATRTPEGRRVWTDADPYGCRVFAVRTETGAHALVVDHGLPSLMPARRDDAQAARLAAAFAAEQGQCAGRDQAAGLYLECVARALKDPAVMMPLFDCANAMPFDCMRDAFMRRPYVLDAIKKIGGLV